MQSNNNYLSALNIPVDVESIQYANTNERQDVQDIDNLRSVNEILPKYRGIFANYPCFNIIQSSVIDHVLHSDESVVVSAPTGSGKTVIFELAVVRFLMNMEKFGCKMPYKIVYVAPMKALCEERLIDWHRKFTKLGLLCISVTGDSDNIDFQSLLTYNLIITTPEKWDSLTRRWRENKKIADLVKLFMIDEIHLVGESNRGPTLEAVICRMKTIQESLSTNHDSMLPSTNMRFVAVSATVPNVGDLAEWLSTPSVPAKPFKFGDSMRPVPLKKVVVGYPYNPQTSTPFKFDLMLNYKLQSIMLQYAEGKPTLIFCSTRKSVEMTSKQITQNITINLNPEQKQILTQATANIQEVKIKEILVNGVCYHHAGLSPEDRRIVEDLFRNCNLPILVTTCTLAMGVNLPAHLVIIKSTKYYANGEYKDYSESMLCQMIGRAGRPQFDTSATAVILTTTNDKKKIESMIDGEQSIESNLHKQLTEHLNAEIVLRTITDLGVAMQWLTSTFLYIRARKHPKYYGLPLGLTQDQIDRRLLDMCQIEINRLARAGMVVIDDTSITLQPTNTGLLMAKYCTAFDTMKLFTQVTGKEILQQMLRLISKCQEFSEIYLRVNDKKTLNLLNKCHNRETIRFPFNDRIKTVDMKINCIIQAVFGCLQILEQSLVTESQKIMRIGERISKCLAEYLETKGDCYAALLSALTLAKCFHTRLWENTPFVSKQLTGIGNVFSSALMNAGITSFKDILRTNPREIERIIHRKVPMGNTIQDQVTHLPNYELFLEKVSYENYLSVNLVIRLNNAEILKVKSSVNVNSCMNLLIGDSDNNIILYEKQLHSHFIENPEVARRFQFPKDYECEVMAHLISEDWVGFDCNVNLITSSAKKTTNNEKKQEVFRRKEISKPKQNKQPSHIQTFMETYFRSSKTKNQRKKNETVTKPSTKPRAPKASIVKNPQVSRGCTITKPKILDDNEKNITSTSVTNQEQTNLQSESKEYQNNEENITSTSFIDQGDFFEDINIGEILSSNKTNFTNRSNENVAASKSHPASSAENQNDSMLQSLIDSSIKEYNKRTDNTSQSIPSISENRNDNIMAFVPIDLNPINSSLVYSDEFTATARRNNTSDLTNQINVIPESVFKYTQQIPVNKKKEFRLGKSMNCSVNFEGSLKKNENSTPKEFIHLNFKYTPSKRYRHDPPPVKTAKEPDNINIDSETSSIENEVKTPRKKSKHEDETEYKIQEFLTPNIVKQKPLNIGSKSNENFQKTLTWRSPLVTSPITKYSPNLNSNFIQCGENFNSSSLRSGKGNATPTRENKPNIRFSIRVNNDPLETSTSTSEGNSTLKTSTSSRPTLKQNLFKNADNVPLSDQAYLHSVSQTNEALTNFKNNARTEDELVSTSFLEDLGLFQKQSQPKNDKRNQDVKPQIQKLKNRKVTTISDYYSKVMKNTQVEEADMGLVNRKDIKVENGNVKDYGNFVNVNNNPNLGIFQNDCKNLAFTDSQSHDNINKSKENDSFDINFDFDMNTTAIPQMFGSNINNVTTYDRFSNNSMDFRDEQNIFRRNDVKNVFEGPRRRFCNRHLTPNDMYPSSLAHERRDENFPMSHESRRITPYYKKNYYSLPNEESEDHCQCHKCLERPWKYQIPNFGNRISPASQKCDCYDHNPSFHRTEQFYSFQDAKKPIIRPTMTQNPPFRKSQIKSAEPKECCNKNLHHNSFSSYSDLNDYAYSNIQRTRFPTLQRVPSFQERYSLHNPDVFYPMPHHYRRCHDDLPKSYHPHPHFIEDEVVCCPENNKDDKQYVLRRYLDSVEEKQVKVSSDRFPQSFEMPEANHLDFTICPDEMDDI